MRHLYIPDTQVKPGVPLEHIDWIGQAIVDYKPDVVIVGGDWWDFPSLSSYEEPGSIALEGARVENDIWVGNEAFKRLCAPMQAEIKRTKKHKAPWNPRKIFTTGNHEDRADRVAARSAKWDGLIGSDRCDIQDFERHPFLKIVWADGVAYSHYFQNIHSGRPIGGTVQNRLTKIGASFTQGHEQGGDWGLKQMGCGKTIYGVVAGSAYVHREKYRGEQGQRHWRGIIVKNEVRDGEYCIMPLSLGYLCEKYEGMAMRKFFKLKYPRGDWEHLT